MITWSRERLYVQPNIAPLLRVVCGNRKVLDSTAAALKKGASLLTEYSAVGSLSAASTRRQEPVKQSLGVVATGLDVWARRYSVPQAENVSRVGNLKLKAVTKPTP